MPGPAAADWRPTAGRDALALRARLLATVRAFFAERGVLEVETPTLSQGATTDPQIDSLHAAVRGAGRRYLHTSPEFAMKRLLAAGVGDLYQLPGAVTASAAPHNVEFTLLEWYRVGADKHALMDEVAEFLRAPRRRACRRWNASRFAPRSIVTRSIPSPRPARTADGAGIHFRRA
jgi:lysyl-tRNA synthetase class 2